MEGLIVNCRGMQFGNSVLKVHGDSEFECTC